MEVPMGMEDMMGGMMGGGSTGSGPAVAAPPTAGGKESIGLNQLQDFMSKAMSANMNAAATQQYGLRAKYDSWSPWYQNSVHSGEEVLAARKLENVPFDMVIGGGEAGFRGMLQVALKLKLEGSELLKLVISDPEKQTKALHRTPPCCNRGRRRAYDVG